MQRLPTLNDHGGVPGGLSQRCSRREHLQHLPAHKAMPTFVRYKERMPGRCVLQPHQCNNLCSLPSMFNQTQTSIQHIQYAGEGAVERACLCTRAAISSLGSGMYASAGVSTHCSRLPCPGLRYSSGDVSARSAKQLKSASALYSRLSSPAACPRPQNALFTAGCPAPPLHKASKCLCLQQVVQPRKNAQGLKNAFTVQQVVQPRRLHMLERFKLSIREKP